MSREEYLRGLEEALAGEVPASVIRENLNYYNSYISQELSRGHTMEDIVNDIGEPRIVARTIIDSSEAAGETGDGYGTYEEAGYGTTEREAPYTKVRYFDLNKWYWKLLAVVVVFFVVSTVFTIVGGILSLLVRFAGPIFMLLLVVWFIRNLRK